jgi:cytochrome c5
VSRRVGVVVVALLLTGCGVNTPHQSRRPMPTYDADAHKVAVPRSEAFHAACAKKGGHVVGQDCVVPHAGGSSIVPIFEDDEARERRP